MTSPGPTSAAGVQGGCPCATIGCALPSFPAIRRRALFFARRARFFVGSCEPRLTVSEIRRTGGRANIENPRDLLSDGRIRRESQIDSRSRVGVHAPRREARSTSLRDLGPELASAFDEVTRRRAAWDERLRVRRRRGRRAGGQGACTCASRESMDNPHGPTEVVGSSAEDVRRLLAPGPHLGPTREFRVGAAHPRATSALPTRDTRERDARSDRHRVSHADGVMAAGRRPTHTTGWVGDYFNDEIASKAEGGFDADHPVVGRVRTKSFAGAWPT